MPWPAGERKVNVMATVPPVVPGQGRACDPALLLWRDRRKVEHAAADGPTVDLHHPRGAEIVERGEPTTIGDADEARSGPLDIDGLRQRGELGQQRMGHTIGRHQTVAHERAVVLRLAEVAAVGQHALAAGIDPAQGVVAPLPHEATLQPVPAEQRPVVRQATGLAHRVVVLAQDQRTPRVAPILGPRRDPAGGAYIGHTMSLAGDAAWRSNVNPPS